jgi:hypothetical protein
MDDTATPEERLADLRARHRELDEEIAALSVAMGPNSIRIQKLKKQKLALKDMIARLESDLLPDIIA